VYVVDVRQKLHFEQVFATAARLGHRARLAHVSFGMLKLSDGQVVATRQAGSSASLNLVDVFDTAVAHARRVADELSGQLSDDERARIAEVLGVGAIRLADLSQNPQSDIVFDWDKMLSLEGRTVTYLEYNYARVKSLFRKAGLDADAAPGAIVIGHPSERTLGLALARFSEAVLDAANTWRPNVIADHLFGIAGAYAGFWRDCRVLADDVPPDVRASRLALSHLTARTLATGMKLLGVEPLERV
jgi:arginyl-tRNA synthetase